MILNIQRSLVDILGEEYLAAVCRARSLLSGRSYDELWAIANEKVDFYPAEFAGVVSGVLNFFMRITLSMYLGVMQSIFGSFDSVADMSFIGAGIAFTFVSVLGVAVTQIGYLFGAKNFKIFSIFSKQNDKKV
jgi:hypothetical protein